MTEAHALRKRGMGKPFPTRNPHIKSEPLTMRKPVLMSEPWNRRNPLETSEPKALR